MRDFMKLNVIFGLMIFTPLFSYTQSNTVLTNKKCSGWKYDINCYPEQSSRSSQLASEQPNRLKAYYRGQKIIIDTQDKESCENIRDYIANSPYTEASQSTGLNSLCTSDPSNPNDRYRIITTMNETTEQYITQLNTKFLTNTEKNILNETRNLSYMMVGSLGLLWFMPESVTKWNKKEVTSRGFFQKYKDNVTHKPVMDTDDWIINYIGHPLSGAAYYTIARSNNYSKMESFGYSVIMSTFFWEYGFEAFAEKPSIQDLIITPVVGSIIGEYFYQWSQQIKNGDGKVLDSRRLGKIALFVLSPAEEISKHINHFLGNQVIKNSNAELILSRKKNNDSTNESSNYIGLQLKFNYW
jgi:hypothetical protein